MRRLDELGIGRPSTWAAIVAVLQERDYAILHDPALRAHRTGPGRRPRSWRRSFGGWVETGFTAAMEEDLDRIAGGALAWRGMLEGFWGGFHPALEKAGALERAAVLKAVEDRLHGFLFGADPGRRRCPACRDGRLELRLSRYGPFVGCAGYPDCGYPPRPRCRRRLHGTLRDLGTDPLSGLAVTIRHGPNGWYVPARVSATARKSRSGCRCRGRWRPIRSISTSPGACWRCPARSDCIPESGEPILAGIGRYGPWLRHEDTYAAIPADEDVLAIGLNRALTLISGKAGPGEPRLGAEAGAAQPRTAPGGRGAGVAQDRPIRPLRRPPAALRVAAGGRAGGRADLGAGGRAPGPVAVRNGQVSWVRRGSAAGDGALRRLTRQRKPDTESDHVPALARRCTGNWHDRRWLAGPVTAGRK